MPYIPTMPKNRIFPVITIALLVPLAALAQAPGAPGGGTAPATVPAAVVEPPTPEEVLLDAAIKKVAALKSVSAKITQKVEMLDQKFSVSGSYLKAPDYRVALNLKVTGLADAAGTMLQVCDGQTLWDYQQILDAQYYRKVDVGQVFEKLKSSELDADLKTAIFTQLGFAGPEALLVGLRKNVRFDQKETVTTDGKDYLVLKGAWKNRDGLLGPNQQPLPPTVKLPPYIPSLVVLTIGKDDGWPYKLRLVGQAQSMLMDTRKIGPDGRPIGARSSIQEAPRTVIELTYTEVKLNPDLKIEDFVFQAPPGARVDDTTAQFVGMLDQAIQNNIARKKAEASKADDPLLKENLVVPRAGDVTPAPNPTAASAKPR